MTYEQMLRKVMANLDSDGADSEAEWAARILKSIGITPEAPPVIPPLMCAPPVIGPAKPLPPIPPVRASTKGW